MKVLDFFDLLKLLLVISGFLLSLKSGCQSIIQSQGLERVIVETYFIHPSIHSNNSENNTLPVGSITYRVFLDLAPGFKLQAVYGTPKQPLRIETTTHFYNNQDFGVLIGNDIFEININRLNVAFDSWLSLGAAAKRHLGVLKEEDSDGSILEYATLKEKDGLLTGFPREINYYNLTPAFFQNSDSSVFMTNNGAWVVNEGVAGPTVSNCILIAQLTTDGAISLALNLQLLTPDKTIAQFVSTKPVGNEIIFNGLIIKQFINNVYGTKSFSQDYKE